MPMCRFHVKLRMWSGRGTALDVAAHPAMVAVLASGHFGSCAGMDPVGGGKVVRHGGAPLLWGRGLNLGSAQRHGLSLEYRHALGNRGFNAGGGIVPGHDRQAERWPLASSLRATRIWVLRKRRRQWLLPGRRAAASAVPARYGLVRMAGPGQRRSGDHE